MSIDSEMAPSRGQSVGCHADNAKGEQVRNGECLSDGVRNFGTASECGTPSVDRLNASVA